MLGDNMTFIIYGVCTRCGKIVETKTTTMNDGEVDGKSYRKVDPKYCGCLNKQNIIDVAKG